MGCLNTRVNTCIKGLALWLGLALCWAWGPWLSAHAQTLIASQDGKLKIPAYWFKLETPQARPLVIGLHGCNGALDAKGRLNPSWPRYAAYFNAEQMHFVVLDSFSPRGLKSICETPFNKRSIDDADRREDVFAAIDWLATEPSVDASRIFVVGWSHGAQTVLSVMDATDKFVRMQKIQPRAAAAFYPGCAQYLRMWNYDIQAPLLVMIGELDDWTLASPCVALRDKVLRGHIDAAFELVVYPDSYHAFDSLVPVRTMNNVGSTRSGKATVGGNPEARKASHAKLFEFLSMQTGEPLQLSHEQRLKLRPSTQRP